MNVDNEVAKKALRDKHLDPDTFIRLTEDDDQAYSKWSTENKEAWTEFSVLLCDIVNHFMSGMAGRIMKLSVSEHIHYDDYGILIIEADHGIIANRKNDFTLMGTTFISVAFETESNQSYEGIPLVSEHKFMFSHVFPVEKLK